MQRDKRKLAFAIIALFIGALWSLLVNGAVPFVGMPTMGQAASMMGYAQAFADQHWYSLHARSFGFPVPTSLATGLPLAWLAGWFVRVGLRTSDAYTMAAAFWLIVGYIGACRLAKLLGATTVVAALSAAAWMTLPMVWAHQSYSSLALGMALLPLYFFSAFALFDFSTLCLLRRIWVVTLFVGLCLTALFMDGYTFMMFAVAGAGVFIWQIVTRRISWRCAAITALPTYLVGYAGAYLLYTAYMGRSAFSPATLDFFRAWGLDLIFLLKPSQGEFWLWDTLGWSSIRSDSVYFGDASVWLTTFALPLAVIGLVCFFVVRKGDPRAWLLLAVAFFGLYMSLGPSLKADAVKPDGVTGPFMQAGSGVMPTGNGIISEHVPGFRAMRASYRWEAMFLLGMWGLVILGAGRSRRYEWAWIGIYVLMITASTPHLDEMWRDYRSYRRDLATIDSEIATPLAAKLHVGSKVFFVPFNNDVMANYLSPKLGVVSYNVGGDKQIEIARERWPANIRAFAMSRFDAGDVRSIREALLDGDADAVIIPYFDSLWAAHLWPCVAEARGYSKRTLALFGANRAFLCPEQIKAAYAANVDALHRDEFLSVDDQPLFAIVTLRLPYATAEHRRTPKVDSLVGLRYPFDVIGEGRAASSVLGEGWNDVEPANRWSSDRSFLKVPVPERCRSGGCAVKLQLIAFAATPRRPVSVHVTMQEASDVALPPVAATWADESLHTLSIPLPAGLSVANLRLDVPAAVSPAELGMSADARVLGVSLHSIDVAPINAGTKGER
jgi:hypothetical protein